MTDDSPSTLVVHAQRISGRDQRFSWLLGPDQTLAEALEEGSLAPELAERGLALAREISGLRTIEDQMRHLIEWAYVSVFRRPPSHAWMAALEARFGVDGSPATLDAAGSIANVTRERVRQVANRVIPLLKGAWLPAVEESAGVLVAASPVAPPIGALLSEQGLTGPSMAAEGFFAIVELIELDIREITGTTLLMENGWVVDEREQSVTGALRIASKHTSTFGMTTVEEIRQELATEEFSADPDDVLRVLRSSPNVKWAGSWLWVDKKSDNSFSSALVNTMRNMLSVNTPLSAQSLHEGVERHYRFRRRDIVPPTAAILAMARSSRHFTVEDDSISPAEPLDYHDVLGPVAASVVDVLKASPYGVMDRASFMQACDDAGIARGTSSVWTSYAEYLENVARNVWGLRGIKVSPALVKEIQTAARTRAQAEPHRAEWAWASDGKIILTVDVDTSRYTTGVWSFDNSLRAAVGGRRLKASAGVDSAGEIAIGAEHNWVWGLSRSMRLLGVQRGDVMRAVLDLSAGTAEISRGGREMWE